MATIRPDTSPAQKARSALATAARRGLPAAEIDQARRDLAEANLRQHIERVVDSAPPLSDAQRERLALILSPGLARTGTTDGA